MIKIVENINSDFLKNKIGVYDEGINIMLDKTKIYNVLVSEISNQAASILKQDMLSIGGDVAVNADVVRYKTGINSCLIIGTKKHFKLLIKKLEKQPFGLQNIGIEIDNVISNYENFVSQSTKIMGILNLTPDSFYDGGKYSNLDSVLCRVEEMIAFGVDILDLGAESSRPGAEPVALDEELNRLLPVLIAIKKLTNIPISIDTYKSEVARICLDEGADIINDISSFSFDEKMVEVVAKYQPKIVLMHMQNTPKDMQKSPQYSDVVDDILKYFNTKINFALEHGIKKEQIILDLGLGFGKTKENNLEILRRIDEFKCFGLPILIGHSRKTFIGAVLDADVEDRLIGSLAVTAFLAEKKINILRVHDVKEHKDTVKMINEINRR
jgi:dihydropteroate synthase